MLHRITHHCWHKQNIRTNSFTPLPGHSRWPFWRHAVFCGRNVRPAAVVACARFDRDLQPSILLQPPHRWCHHLDRVHGGTARGRHKISVWPLSLGMLYSSCMPRSTAANWVDLHYLCFTCSSTGGQLWSLYRKTLLRRFTRLANRIPERFT